MRQRRVALTEGSILQGLVRMALPIVGTSFIQMTYSLTDMFWIGRVGDKALSAVAIGGFFMWMANAFIVMAKTGTEVRVAQRNGAKREKDAEGYARSGLQLVILLAVVYSATLLILRRPLIGFFNIESAEVHTMAYRYLTIIASGMIFPFAAQVFTGIYNGHGDSRTPFVINVIGLSLNMVLDPLFIFGLGWGAAGAAAATVTAQFVAFAIFFYKIKIQHSLFANFTFFTKFDLPTMRDIGGLGFYPGLQSGFFTSVSMIIARLVSSFGDTPLGIQKVGSQIEALTWMTAVGISVALSAFVGQNYGAQQWNRVIAGYRTGFGLALGLGTFTTALFFFGAEPIFAIFVQEPESLAMGVQYLRILAASQLFMCVEITISGVFNGMGQTKIPSVIGVVGNGLRIPIALFLSQYTFLGLNGIWWSISISSILKGTVAWLWIEHTLRAERATTTMEGDLQAQSIK